MRHHASADVLQVNLAIYVIDIEFTIDAAYKNIAVIHRVQRSSGVRWDRDDEINRALVGVRTDSHIVILCLDVEPRGGHGNALHALSPAAAAGLFTTTPRSRFDDDFFYVCAFYRNAAAHQMSSERHRTRWISKRHSNFIVILRPHWLCQCEQGCCCD